MASALSTGFSFSLQGQAWGHPGWPERTNVFIERDSLPIGLSAPLLTVFFDLQFLPGATTYACGLEPLLYLLQWNHYGKIWNRSGSINIPLLCRIHTCATKAGLGSSRVAT